MAMLSFEKKYRVRGGTLLGGDLFDFWMGPFYVGFFGVTTIFFAFLGTALILWGASQGPTWNLWQISIAPPDLSYGLRFAPLMKGGLWQLITVCAIGAFGLMPFGNVATIPGTDWTIHLYIADTSVSLLVVAAIGSLGFYGLMIGGWASSSKYALLGGMRAIAQLVSYEVAFTLAVIGVIIQAGSLSFINISNAGRVLPSSTSKNAPPPVEI